MKIKNCCFHKKLSNKKNHKSEELAEKIQPSLDLFYVIMTTAKMTMKTTK